MSYVFCSEAVWPVKLAPNVLHYTVPHKLCKCEVKDVYSLQSFISTHSEESESAFHLLYTIGNDFNLCLVGTEFSHFLTGVGVGV